MELLANGIPKNSDSAFSSIVSLIDLSVPSLECWQMATVFEKIPKIEINKNYF